MLIVDWNGWVCFHGVKLKLSAVLHREPVAFRANPDVDSLFGIYYCHQLIDQLDLRESQG